MRYTDDPAGDAAARDLEHEARMKTRPTCDQCGEPVQDDHYFEVTGSVICPECWGDYVYENFYIFIEEDA